MNLYQNADAILPPDELNDTYFDQLRWMLSVVDENDTCISFLSGCLSYLTKPGAGRLTERQCQGINKVFARVRADFYSGQLDCLYPFADEKA